MPTSTRPTPPMMACGHAANATSNGKPCCAICLGNPAAETVAETPDLTGRQAMCGYCRTTVPSKLGLAFFAHRPKAATDSFYCGCRGWN